VNTFISLNFAENPITDSSFHDECFDVGDFHIFMLKYYSVTF